MTKGLMDMARNELTYRCFIEIDGKEPVPIDSLSSEEKERVMGIWSDRLGRNMSAWYSQHPEEYARL